MNAERHQRISELFLQACEVAVDERAAFLEEACQDDPSLKGEVAALLAADDTGEMTLGIPAGTVLDRSQILDLIYGTTPGIDQRLDEADLRVGGHLRALVLQAVPRGHLVDRYAGGEVRSFGHHRQIVDLAFKMNKIKTKYNALAQCKPESLSLSTALLAIY